MRENVQSQGQSAETPTSLHWSQTTTATTATTTTATTATTNVHHQSPLHVTGRCCETLQYRHAGDTTPRQPALHLLLPTMKTYKFQVAITTVCHKAVDPSVVTQPPVTLTSEMIAVYADAARHSTTSIDSYQIS